MQEVRIYVDAYHTGNLKTGTGTYTVILEYTTKDRWNQTMDLIRGYSSTTKNRIALLACITALKRMKRPCKILLMVNSKYVAGAVNTGNWLVWLETGQNAKGKQAANLDLWKQLYNLAMIHEIEFVYKERNSYTDCMMREMQRRKIDLKEDRNEDNCNEKGS